MEDGAPPAPYRIQAQCSIGFFECNTFPANNCELFVNKPLFLYFLRFIAQYLLFTFVYCNHYATFFVIIILVSYIAFPPFRKFIVFNARRIVRNSRSSVPFSPENGIPFCRNTACCVTQESPDKRLQKIPHTDVCGIFYRRRFQPCAHIFLESVL